MRHAISLLSFVFLALAGSAVAADKKPFDMATFAALQQAGKPILVDVHADWCPICKRQAPIISSIATNPKYQDLTILVVDYDNQEDALKKLKVADQSTLIVFKGSKEKGRSTGDSREKSVLALVDKAFH